MRCKICIIPKNLRWDRLVNINNIKKDYVQCTSFIRDPNHSWFICVLCVHHALCLTTVTSQKWTLVKNWHYYGCGLLVWVVIYFETYHCGIHVSYISLLEVLVTRLIFYFRCSFHSVKPITNILLTWKYLIDKCDNWKGLKTGFSEGFRGSKLDFFYGLEFQCAFGKIW